MAKGNLKLTSVKLVDHLFEDFRKKLHNHTDLTISGSL